MRYRRTSEQAPTLPSSVWTTELAPTDTCKGLQNMCPSNVGSVTHASFSPEASSFSRCSAALRCWYVTVRPS